MTTQNSLFYYITSLFYYVTSLIYYVTPIGTLEVTHVDCAFMVGRVEMRCWPCGLPASRSRPSGWGLEVSCG